MTYVNNTDTAIDGECLGDLHVELGEAQAIYLVAQLGHTDHSVCKDAVPELWYREQFKFMSV